MFFLKKANCILKKFKRDESGTTALTWALSLTVIMGAMGASLDFVVASNADARSQTIADNTALAAAIYVKTHGRPPTADEELTAGTHNAAELGYEYKSSVIGGANGVDVEIIYDDNAKEVTTIVSGKTNPLLAQILGVDEIDFSAVSVASYLNIEDTFPASIALILDNSGSMQFDDRLPLSDDNNNTYFDLRCPWNGQYVCDYVPAGHNHGTKDPEATIRLVGLKNSVVKFQDDMKARLGEEDTSGRRTLRMGMLPYSSAIISAGQQPMMWGYLNEGNPGHVNNNSNPNDDVNNAIGIYGMKADGGTNSSPPMSTAKTWLEAEDRIHSDEAKRAGVPDDKDPLKFVIFMTDGQNTVGNYAVVEGATGQWHRELSPGNWDTKSFPKNGYLEGTLTLQTDAETAESCRQMKEQGVTIFTIGYALEDFGNYRVNGWAGHDNDHLREISPSVQSAAFALMQSCASTEDHFIRAGDAGQLEAAFDEIQNAIVEELIRLKS